MEVLVEINHPQGYFIATDKTGRGTEVFIEDGRWISREGCYSGRRSGKKKSLYLFAISD